MNVINVTVHHILEKCFLFVFQSKNSFAMSMMESLSVLCFCMFKNVRLLNRSWFILEQSHVFSLREVENDLSPAAVQLAVVAGFAKIRLHNVITSFIITRFGLGNYNSVYLSARLSLLITMVTFKVAIFCYFWLRYLC